MAWDTFFFTQKYEEDRDTLEKAQIEQITNLYESTLTTYRLNAKSVFENIVMQPDVLKILRQLPGASDQEIQKLHNALYQLLKDRYQHLKSSLDIRQLHFHLVNGNSFLRMHRPEKYGDPLFDVRYSVKMANTNKHYVEGFEEGRIFNGYRYVFPIIDNNVHLGSVEVSVSMGAVIKQLAHIYKNHAFNVIIDKKVIKQKVFESEKSNYLISKINTGFLVDHEVNALFANRFEFYLERISHNASLLEKIKKYQPFTVSESIEGSTIIVTFIPILNVKRDAVAYLVDFQHSDLFVVRQQTYWYQLLVSFMVLVFVFSAIIYVLRQKQRKDQENQKLIQLVQLKTQELEKEQKHQLQYYRNLILALVNLIEARDTYTAGHTHRVAEYATMIAKSMGYDEATIEKLNDAAILHDIGKIVTPDSILLKPGKLSKKEFDIIQEHVVTSKSILRNINFDEEIIDIVKYHHERYDGSGYPYGVKNDQVPMLARVLAVADSFDAMTTNRIYKPRKTLSASLEELKNLAGVLYDPLVIKHALEVFKDVEIDMSVTQMPTSVIEQERLSHYFKDPLTHLYNLSYLQLLLEHGIEGTFHRCIYLIAIKHFSELNRTMGWETGNRVLESFAEYLENIAPECMIFRIYGDDFVILSHTKQDLMSSTMHDHFETFSNFRIDFEISYYDIENEKNRLDILKKLENAIG
jgi:putative nucleotidyltransferase with HDIG domain